MEYRQLGRSGLKVSALAFGSGTFGHGDPATSAFFFNGIKEARRQFDLCFDAGVTLVDTANAYGGGASEEIMGEVLEGRRNDVLIASKMRFPMGPGPNDRGLSRHHILASCEASLRRLRTDYIDLYMFHEWDGLTPVDEMMEALDRLVAAGKVGYVGCSNFSGWHIMKALAAADARLGPRFVFQQIHYTLYSREAEQELVPISVDQGLGILVWGPLAGGLLSGKYGRGMTGPTGSRHIIGFKEPPIPDPDRLFTIVDELKAIATEKGVTPSQVALAWTLGRPAIASVIIGGRTDEHFRENLKAAEVTLTADERDRLEKVSRRPLTYPYWHQHLTASDRLSPADLVLHSPYLEKGA
jgi:aryl-alcohol dehydrogenase-like predicted oxidoreductase